VRALVDPKVGVIGSSGLFGSEVPTAVLASSHVEVSLTAGNGLSVNIGTVVDVSLHKAYYETRKTFAQDQGKGGPLRGITCIDPPLGPFLSVNKWLLVESSGYGYEEKTVGVGKSGLVEYAGWVR
jgi:hypothetical protein